MRYHSDVGRPYAVLALLSFPVQAHSYGDLAGGWIVVNRDSPERGMRGPGPFVFTANPGRYRVNGNQLTHEALVARNPGYMAQWDPETGGTP